MCKLTCSRTKDCDHERTGVHRHRRVAATYFLPDLYRGSPIVRCEGLHALGALLRVDNVGDDEALLDHDLGDGVLNGDLDFNPTRMRLCPDEARINDSYVP